MTKTNRRWWDTLPARERKLLNGTGSELKLLEPAVLDNAIVGYGRLLSDPSWFVIYDYHKVEKVLADTWVGSTDDETLLEIDDHIACNIAGSWVGASTWMLSRQRKLSAGCVYGDGQRCGQKTVRIYDLLEMYEFMARAGKPVDMDALLDGLKDKRNDYAIVIRRSRAELILGKAAILPKEADTIFKKVKACPNKKSKKK